MTGLAAKLSALVFLMTGDVVWLTLIVAAIMTIILGMGMPTVSSYILAAVLIGPLLIKLGIPEMAAHLFLLYYAVLVCDYTTGCGRGICGRLYRER